MTVAEIDDLFAPEVIADPYTYFAALRETGPVYWNDRFKLWVITGYEEVVWMLGHHELFSSAIMKHSSRVPDPPVNPEDLPLFDEVREFRGDQIVEQDRPEHLEQRSVVHEYFTPAEMESWRPFVRDAVMELLDELEPGGRMDVLSGTSFFGRLRRRSRRSARTHCTKVALRGDMS